MRYLNLSAQAYNDKPFIQDFADKFESGSNSNLCSYVTHAQKME